MPAPAHLLSLRTPAGRLHGRLDGPDTAPALVFSNSHATALSLWDGPVAHLADRYRILRYDQRGHGASDPPAAPCSFDSLADDLVALMDHAGLAQATLIGVSMGAVTVLRAAARWPDRVRAVVACDGQWCTPPHAPAVWQPRMDRVRQSGTAVLAEETVQRWFTPAWREQSRQAVERMVHMIAGTSTEGYIACAQAMQDYDFRSDAATLSMPVLYVAGSEDGALPQVMRTMASATPNGRYGEIAGAGHLPHIERLDDFMALVGSFIDGCHAPGQGRP